MSTKNLKKAVVVFDWANNLFAYLAMVCIYIIMLSVCFDATMNFLVRRPQNWVPEVTEYSLVAITFLGGAWVLRRKQHIRIDTLLTHFKPSVRRGFDIATSLICASGWLVIFWYGARITWEHYQIHYTLPTVLETPSYISMVLIPIGAFMLGIQFILEAGSNWANNRSESPKDTEI
jgi:TRAP-type C4-dicarboxylate transport system permease small subunit